MVISRLRSIARRARQKVKTIIVAEKAKQEDLGNAAAEESDHEEGMPLGCEQEEEPENEVYIDPGLQKLETMTLGWMP